jgi:hypothetical protein
MILDVSTGQEVAAIRGGFREVAQITVGVNKSPSVAVLPETGGARWSSPVLILAGTAGILVGVAIHSCRKLRRRPSASR